MLVSKLTDKSGSPKVRIVLPDEQVSDKTPELQIETSDPVERVNTHQVDDSIYRVPSPMSLTKWSKSSDMNGTKRSTWLSKKSPLNIKSPVAIYKEATKERYVANPVAKLKTKRDSAS